MDTYEGDSQLPSSLHRYLYSSGDPVNRVDPSGRLDMVDITSALTVISVLASQAWIAVQNVSYSIYFNLYRAPEILDAVASRLLLLQGTLQVGSVAESAVEQMARNLQNSTQTLPAGGCPMGNCVEDIAGRSLIRGAQSYDYFDKQNQIAGQIQGTRAVSSADALMQTIKKGVGKLTGAPEVVNTYYEGGGEAQITKSDLKVRFLVQAIPSKQVSWNFQAFMQQVEQLEETEKVIVKIVPTPGLD
jgi:hypothetical protein